MNKIAKFFNSRIGFALVSNAITVIVALIMFRPFWEESDDVGKAFIAEGAYGYYEPHLLYSSTIYGRILCFLQRIIPVIRWHAVIMILMTFITLTAFVYILAKNKSGRVLSIVFLLSMLYETYVSIQYSKMASIIAMCCFIVLFETVRDDELSAKEKRICTVLAMIGSEYSLILRQESFLLAALIAGSYGGCLVVFEGVRGNLRNKIKACFIAFFPVFAIGGVLVWLNVHSYSSGGWKDYMDYYNSVSDMVDYHNEALLYERHGDELKALGVSENDAKMYITYEALEEEFTTPDLMGKITDLEPKGIDYISVDFFKAWIANVYKDIIVMNSTVIGALLLLGMLLSYISDRTDRADRAFAVITISVQFMIAIAVLFYYQYSSRWSHRVVYALFLVQIILLTYLVFCSESLNLSRFFMTSMYLVLIFSIIRLKLGNEFEFRKFERNAFEYDELTSYMEQNKDKLFITDVFTMLDQDKYEIFRPSRIGQFDNCIPADSVYLMNSPVVARICENYGYKSPFEALSSRDDNVFLADGLSPEIELTFCNEHGNGGAYSLEKRYTIGGINLYNIR